MKTIKYNNNPINIILVMLCMLLSTGTLMAQQISGPDSVNEGTTNITYSISGVTGVVWNVSGAISYNPTGNTVNVNAGSSNFTVSAQFNEAPNFTSKFVTVIPNAPPSPPNPTASTANCQVTLTRSGSPSGGVVWYWQGRTANGTHQNKGQGSTYVANEGSGDYYIRAYDPNTQQWSLSVGSVNVTIPSTPGAPSVLGDNPRNICLGDTVTFTVSSPVQGSTYSWYNQEGNFQNTGTSWSVTPGASRTYTVTETTSQGCTGPARTLTVNVNDPVAPDGESKTNVCGSSEITVFARSMGVTSPVTHKWYSHPTNNTPVTFEIESGVPSGQYVTKKTVTGVTQSFWVATVQGGCESDTRVQVTATYVDNSQVPTLSLGDFSSANNGCGTGSFDLRASGGEPGSEYRWFANATGGAALHTGGTYLFNLDYANTTNGQKTYYVEATMVNTAGCSIETTSRESITVNVNPVPGAPSGNDVSFCGSSTVNLTATPGANANQLRWYSSASGGSILSTANTFTTPTLSSTTSYYVESYNTSTQCVSGSRTEIQAIAGSAPALTVTDATNDCFSDDILITAASNNVSGIEHIWYTSASGTGTANENVISTVGQYVTGITVTAETKSYWVAAKVGNCEGPRQQVTATYTPSGSTPTLTVTDVSTSTDRCGTGDFILAAEGGQTGSIYEWFDTASGGSPIHTGANYQPTITYAQTLNGDKTYYVGGTLTNAQGCETTITSRVAITVSLVPIPDLPSGDAVLRCGPGTVDLTASLGNNGGTLRWFDQLSGGTQLGTGSTFTTPSLTTTTTYYVESYNGTTGCVSGRHAIEAQITSGITWYLDADSDGFAPPNSTIENCDSPGPNYTQTVLPETDCNDGNANINPNTIWYLDNDNDGLGDPANPSTASCTQPSGYVLNSNDQCPGITSSTNNCSGGTNNPLDQNYVYTRAYQAERTTQTSFFTANDSLIQNISYFDGLGRPIQQIGIDQTPTKDDIVTFMDYDEYGRMEKEYLPYPETDNNLATYRLSAESNTLSYYNQAKYQNTTNPFSEKQFETSPLNRVEKQAAPGEAWKMGNTHEIEFDYLTNTSADGVKQYYADVVLTTVDGVHTYIPTLELANTNAGEYLDGVLYKNITYDENHAGGVNHSVEEFTDKNGKLILKRTYANGEAHDTYYVYDKFDNLSYVLSPKMDAGTATLQNVRDNMDALGYRYVYDRRNRLVIKQIPGKQEEHIIYNTLDQPIMTQDANQRATGEWLFTKYDPFGRVAFTGKAIDGRERTVLQNEANTSPSAPWVTQYTTGSTSNIGGTILHYNSAGYPSSAITEVLTVNYYDNYSTARSGTATSVTSFGLSSEQNAQGLATESKVKVLDVSPEKWITTVTYYDDKARPIYTYTNNEYLGTVDIVELKLDFTGRTLQSKSQHTRNGTTISTLDSFTYDHVGRLLAQTQCIGDETMGYNCSGASGGGATANLSLTGTVDSDQVATNSIVLNPDTTVVPDAVLSIDPNAGGSGGDQELIVYNTYDALGRLDNKKVGGTASAILANSPGLQTVKYDYNVRDWLLGINDSNTTDNVLTLASDDLFGFKINYDAPASGTPLFNGNISETYWDSQSVNNTANPVSNKYTYSYDALNRITAATDNTGNYNLSGLTYDKNGNIEDLIRTGHTNATATSFGTMDDLDYAYIGNQLQSVDDAIGSSATQGFVDGAELATEYTYDANGNLTSDLNKGIAADDIEYNHLNLPTKITVSSGSDTGILEYEYAADGTKVQKIKKNLLETVLTTTDYVGNYVYENNILKQITGAEGYIEPDGINWQYIYRYTDIWGNTRITYADDNNDGSIDTDTEIRREQNYYPFGLEHQGYNNVSYGVKNNLKTYQGQEFTQDLELNTHEWKYRMSDPTIGRFWQIDPLAEDYLYNSTYAFQENKLGSGIELEGLENEGWTGTAEEQEVFHEMSKELQGALAELGAFIDSFFVSESNTVKEEFTKVGNEKISNTTTIEAKTTTTVHTNLEAFISNVRPSENGDAIMPNTPVTITEEKSTVSIKNTTKLKVNIRGFVSVTEKLNTILDVAEQDIKVSGSVDAGLSAGGNSAGVFIDASTSTNSGDTKVRAGIRTTVKKDNRTSTFTLGYEHKIQN